MFCLRENARAGFAGADSGCREHLPPNSEEVAKSCSSYLLPFEIASVLLLVAMIVRCHGQGKGRNAAMLR